MEQIGRMTRYQTLMLLCEEGVLAGKPTSKSATEGRAMFERTKVRDAALADELLKRLRKAVGDV